MVVEVMEFAYTDASKIPEHHRTIAFQYAIGIKTWDIAGGMGIKSEYVEKVLAHPPVVDMVLTARKILDMQVLGDVAKWTGLLGKAIDAVRDSLDSGNERIRLTAALEYLNRHPSTIFVARRPSDGARDTDVMDNAAIKELKHHALQIKGESSDVESAEETTAGPEGLVRALPPPAPASTGDSGDADTGAAAIVGGTASGGPSGRPGSEAAGATPVPDPVGWPPESSKDTEGAVGGNASGSEEGRSGRDSRSKTSQAELADQDPV